LILGIDRFLSYVQSRRERDWEWDRDFGAGPPGVNCQAKRSASA